MHLNVKRTKVVVDVDLMPKVGYGTINLAVNAAKSAIEMIPDADRWLH